MVSSATIQQLIGTIPVSYIRLLFGSGRTAPVSKEACMVESGDLGWSLNLPALDNAAGSSIIPVEVKAGKSGALRSMHRFIEEKRLPLGVSLYCGPDQIRARLSRVGVVRPGPHAGSLSRTARISLCVSTSGGRAQHSWCGKRCL